MKTFCERLRELRKENKLTTTELAEKLNISQSSISRWENGERRPNIKELYNIALFFNVTSDYLLGLED